MSARSRGSDDDRPAVDPIAEARRQWIEHGWPEAAEGMSVVTSVMRVQQLLLARIDVALAPFDLTFARYEILQLLRFSRTGALPLGKIGSRLQVHPTSASSAVDRLERQGFVRRSPHPTDGRTTLIEILPAGRAVVARATAVLNAQVFGVWPVDGPDPRPARPARGLPPQQRRFSRTS